MDSSVEIPNDTGNKCSKRRSEHWWSTLGLCGSAFSMFYLIMNVFPYSGFMALHLLDKNSSTHTTAATIGPYAGILVSSFRLGRIPTAIPWGNFADVYGRKFALIVSLVAMIFGNLLFGVAPSYTWAVAIRFVTGILNGTMVVVRTSITEIAKGDSFLESKGVAMMSAMSGYGMLVGPAVGGLLSEPLFRFPGVFGRLSRTKELLTTYPFFLPNAIGSLVAFVSLVLVVLCVEETLPPNQRRDWRLFPMDMMLWIKQSAEGWNSVWISTSRRSETESASVVTENTILVPVSERKAEDYKDESPTPSTPFGVLQSFLSTRSNVRYFFYSMWFYAFTSLASSEAFPLFAMTSTSKGGLGLDETGIGIVQTIAGLVFVMGQYAVFTSVKNRFGLMTSLRLGALYSNLLWILVPLGIYISPTNTYNRWCQLGFLGFVSGITAIFGSIFMGCATIGVNGSIKKASQRASMNGLQSMVASLGRGLGPIFSGFLIASIMSSEAIPSRISGWVVYLVLVSLGLVTYASTMIIPEIQTN